MISIAKSSDPIRHRFVVAFLAVATTIVSGGAGWVDGKLVKTPTPLATIKAHKRSIKTWHTTGNFECPGPTLAFSPDGRRLATGNEDKTIRIWDVESGKLVREIPFSQEKLEAIAFTTDGRTVLAEWHSSTAMVWFNPGREPGEAPEPPPPPVGRDTKGIAPYDPRPIVRAFFFDIETGDSLGAPMLLPTRMVKRTEGRAVFTLNLDGDPRRKQWADAMLHKPGGSWGFLSNVGPVLVSADGSQYIQFQIGEPIDVVNAARGEVLLSIPNGHIHYPTFQFSPDGRWIAASNWQKDWFVTRIADGMVRKTSPSGNRSPVAFSPDSRFVAVARTLKPEPEPVIVQQLPRILRLILRQNNPRWAGREEHQVVIWDVATGMPRALLRGHKDNPTSLAFSPDGKTLATVDFDSQLKLWTSPDGNW